MQAGPPSSFPFDIPSCFNITTKLQVVTELHVQVAIK